MEWHVLSNFFTQPEPPVHQASEAWSETRPRLDLLEGAREDA